MRSVAIRMRAMQQPGGSQAHTIRLLRSVKRLRICYFLGLDTQA
jgi:hypothetical protein